MPDQPFSLRQSAMRAPRHRARPFVACLQPMPLSGVAVLIVLAAGLSGQAAHAGCGEAPGPGVDWTQCEKPRLVLRGVNLAGARLGGADFNGTDFQRANLVGADLTHASVDRARLSGADLSRSKLTQLNGYRANLTGAILVGADLTKAEMARSILVSANLSRANLTKAEFQRANLEGSNLEGANLSGSDLARANFTKTRLDGARMNQARTFRTRFEGVNLSGVVGLTAAQLESACGDAATRLPEGLKAPKNWPWQGRVSPSGRPESPIAPPCNCR